MGAPTLGFRSVNPTTNQNISGLLAGIAWDAGAGQTTNTITYSFPTSATDYGTGQGTGPDQYPTAYPFTGFSAVTAVQMAEVQRAFALISSYTGLTFTQVTEGPASRGTLRFANTSPSVLPTANGQFPGAAVSSGDMFFGGIGQAPQLGNYDSVTTLHELGHMLGLKHGQENGIFGPVLSDTLDSEYSVMDYPTYIGQNRADIPSNTAGPGSSPQTYMMYDIAALQYLYGANYSLQGTSTTYTWSPTTGEEFINGVGQGVPAANKIFMTVWDQGANSTYDLSNFNQACYLDMRPGGWMRFSNPQLADLGYGSPDYGPGKLFARANVYNALLNGTDTRSEIDNLITGNGNDTVYGNDVFNAITLGNGNDLVYCGTGGSQIVAGNGNDQLFGGLGNDTFTLTGGTYDVSGGSGNNILNLKGLVPINGAPFTISNNNGTGTVYEGTVLRVTFTGIATIEQPDAPTIIGGGPAGQPSSTPTTDTVEPSATASASTGQPAEATSMATLTDPPGLSFISGSPEVNPVDLIGTQQSEMLQLGTLDQISGFNPGSDTLNVSQVLTQSHLSLSDLSQAGNYFGLTDSAGNATLSFYPNGVTAGGGTPLATLIGVGPSVTLDTLISDGALKLS